MSEVYEEYYSIIIKFGDKKWIDKLMAGEIFMQPLQYYRDLEEEELIKGQGDKYEGILNISIKDFKYQSDDENINNIFNLIRKGSNIRMSLKHNGDEEYLVACFYSVDNNRFRWIGSDENYKYYKYEFTEEEKNIFSKWGDSALIINKFVLINKMYEEMHHIAKAFKEVKYYDPNNPDIELLCDYQKLSISRLFWKDIFFKDQQEFRILIDKKDKKGKVVTNLGDISSFTRLESSRELLERGFIINVNK